MRAIKAIDRALSHLEEAFVVLSLSSMVVVAFIQVILRNVFSTGLTWADELLRHLVLWTGFIAGSLATREGRHIAIDIMSRMLPPAAKRANDVLVSAGALAFCVFLFKASWYFVSVERSYGEFSGSLRTPVWVLEIIFPVTFGLLAVRFSIKIIEALIQPRS